MVDNCPHRQLRARYRHSAMSQGQKKAAGPKPRRHVACDAVRDQRSSWSTLCCDWLASDSAETAID
jgi:hypothetical protein